MCGTRAGLDLERRWRLNCCRPLSTDVGHRAGLVWFAWSAVVRLPWFGFLILIWFAFSVYPPCSPYWLCCLAPLFCAFLFAAAPPMLLLNSASLFSLSSPHQQSRLFTLLTSSLTQRPRRTNAQTKTVPRSRSVPYDPRLSPAGPARSQHPANPGWPRYFSFAFCPIPRLIRLVVSASVCTFWFWLVRLCFVM